MPVKCKPLARGGDDDDDDSSSSDDSDGVNDMGVKLGGDQAMDVERPVAAAAAAAAAAEAVAGATGLSGDEEAGTCALCHGVGGAGGGSGGMNAGPLCWVALAQRSNAPAVARRRVPSAPPRAAALTAADPAEVGTHG